MEINRAIHPIRFHFLVSSFYFPERTRLKSVITSLFRAEQVKLERLTCIFCSDDYLLDINKAHLGHDYLTDIITFDLSGSGGIVGEIYISVDRVRENAVTFKTGFQHELRRVLFHGALHLCGYRDKTPAEKLSMRAAEDKYLHLFTLA